MDQTAEIADLQRRLAESETRHRLLVGQWAQAEWETDAQGVVVADIPSWRAYTGQSVDEWLGKGWLDAIHPDDRSYAERQWREAVAAHGLVNAEFRLRAPDGGWRWTNVRAAPVLDGSGNIEKWAGLNIDIDARKRAEAALRASEEKYRSLFESMDEAYAVVEVLKDGAGKWADFRFLDANRAFVVHTSMPYPVGKTATELLGSPNPRWTELYGHALDTSEPIRVDETEHTLGRTFDLNIFPLDRARNQVAVLFTDITERKLAERTLRESEERQAFLLKLSDTLRGESEQDQIEQIALDLLAEHLSADRAYITTSDYGKGETVVPAEVRHADLPPLIGVFRHADFPESASLVNEGTLVIENVEESTQLSEPNRRSFEAIRIGALIGVGLRKGVSDIFWTLAVATSEPRNWTTGEVVLMEEAAERILAATARARADAALRESEERFAQFAKASAAGLWIRQADTLAMEFVSPAIATVYGVEADALLGDVSRWAAMIVPEDRDAALGHLERARKGEVAAYEFRIQRPADGTFRWIRNTDFPLRNEREQVQRIGGIAEDVTEAKLAVEHSAVLLAELQHRVRNIMALVRSLANRTAPGASGIEDYRSLVEGRLLALARVQTLLTREVNAGGSLKEIIESEVAAQAYQSGQYTLSGPDITLSPKAVEVLTLAFHELATNALKYGALSVPKGCLTVTWTPIEKRGRPWLSLDWIEENVPSREPSSRRGFGSELIEARIPYELGGRGAIAIEEGGARCHLEFPLKDGESILETDAPQPATVFGGSLDMSAAPDLTGRKILVVEDDYFLASDTAAALRGAGAIVLGPCPTEERVHDLLEDEMPTHAVLDLNLGGGGPRFEIAHLLKAHGVPFIFLTGYDPNVVPDDMRDIVRLQKPLPFRAIVEAVSQL